MAFDQSEWVWMDGACIPWSHASVHVSSHALHYGAGVFEGMRCYETSEGPAVFRLDAHLDRLYASADVYGMSIPYSKQQLTDAICELIRQCGFASCYVRPICYFGSESLSVNPRGCPVEVVIFAWPWGDYLGEGGLERGVRISVSPWVKFSSRMMPTTAKACGQYLNSILAVREAAGRGFDEALLLDEKGNLAEGSGENIFLVKDGRLFTNDEQSSILLGITRDAVLKIAEDLGLSTEIGVLTLDQLKSADESFFTGTAVEVTPIRELDGLVIGSGKRGPITEKIQQRFFEITSGERRLKESWLHIVKTGEGGKGKGEGKKLSEHSCNLAR